MTNTPTLESAEIKYSSFAELSKELADHAETYRVYAKLRSDAEVAEQMAHARLKRVKGETDLRIRGEDPVKNGLPKYTEGAIDNLVSQDPEVMNAQTLYAQLQSAKAQREAEVDALKVRTRMLELIVKLETDNG